jgi:hypothetical protein
MMAEQKGGGKDFLRVHHQCDRFRLRAVCLLLMTLKRRNHVAKPLGIETGELARRL